MQRNWFFGELLTQLFQRRAPLFGSKDDTRSIIELCDALLSAEGEVSGYRIASTLLKRYQEADDAQKLVFFDYLNSELDVDAEKLSELAQSFVQAKDTDVYKALSRAAEPKRQELLRRLNQPTGATQGLVKMRIDLLNFLKDHPDLKRTDFDFRHLLHSWFNLGFLVLKQINWDTPARILDKIIAYEAVHEISDLDDLRKRLLPSDRRCFAFFHPSMPDEPLIFIEVALTREVPGSIDGILLEKRVPLAPENARVAVFYSISNCQVGLRGISFGNLLIKQVVKELSLEMPNLNQFVTLSPIPNLNTWLESKLDDAELGFAASEALEAQASDDTVAKLAARYLTTAKRKDGHPFDPVARFHLGNGAEIYAVHSRADLSENGQKQSSGAMVNYHYDLAKTELNHEDFVRNGKVSATKEVLAMARADFTIQTMEK